MEKHIKAGFIILASSIIALAILVTSLRTEGMAPEDSDKVIELIRKGELTEKQVVVADIKHEVLKGPKYTIRVGLGGSRKPIPAINGLTTEERAKEWLEKASLGYTLPTWVRLGEKYKVDYALPICIAWADSHLGKALKSTNNIGNYGNNDRGDTRSFETLEAGIEAIYWGISKGKYMSGHTVIGTLSGEGRKRLGIVGCNAEQDYRKKCYASSLGVWSTNVANCMSAIHDKQIDEKYNFKLK